MQAVLLFLATEGVYLYEERGFRIIDGKYVGGFSGQGYVTLTDGKMDIYIWLDRDQLIAAVRRANAKARSSWYSIDILRRLFGDRPHHAVLDAENSAWLKTNIAKLQAAFEPDAIHETVVTCARLRRERVKRMFG